MLETLLKALIRAILPILIDILEDWLNNGGRDLKNFLQSMKRTNAKVQNGDLPTHTDRT